MSTTTKLRFQARCDEPGCKRKDGPCGNSCWGENKENALSCAGSCGWARVDGTELIYCKDHKDGHYCRVCCVFKEHTKLVDGHWTCEECEAKREQDGQNTTPVGSTAPW